jgi:hypothetical protein
MIRSYGEYLFMLKYFAVGTTTFLLLMSIGAHAQPAQDFLDLRVAGTAGGGNFKSVSQPGSPLNAIIEDGLGWGLRGAWTFADNWQIYGEWGTSNTVVSLNPQPGTITAAESDFDLDRISIGVGYHWPLNGSWSAYSRLTWDWADYGDFDEFDIAGHGRVIINDIKDSGIGATIGVRRSVAHWELESWGRFRSTSKLTQNTGRPGFDSGLGAGLRVVYHLNDSYSLGADYEISAVKTWSVLFRYRF